MSLRYSQINLDDLRKRITSCKTAMLHLNDYCLHSEDLAVLIEAINANEHITCITLASNELDSAAIPHIAKLKNVTKLDLSYNNISEDNLEILTKSVQFTSINLSHNNIHERGLALLEEMDRDRQFIVEGNPGNRQYTRP